LKNFNQDADLLLYGPKRKKHRGSAFDGVLGFLNRTWKIQSESYRGMDC